ncbi:MAG: hypothetical protein ABEJ98_01970 [Candidatus Nanohaloarchaea archaeon]
MAINEIIMVLNAAGTLAIGVVCFFMVYTSFRNIEREKIQEFSKRFMMAIAVLILYVSYLMFYNAFFPDNTLLRYPLYLSLILVFVYLIWTARAFEDLAEQYGISQDSKLEKMENQEFGGD